MTEIAATLPAGRSLDLGCGNGGDAIWLAQHGWRATGADVSSTVLEVARAKAAELGLSDRVDFQRHDLTERAPEGPFDLITASFFHSPVETDRDHVLHSVAELLAPGGVLLIIDHASTAPWSWKREPGFRFPTPEETLAGIGLDPAGWTTGLAERRDRLATGPDGDTATVSDNVILVRRVAGGRETARPDEVDRSVGSNPMTGHTLGL